MSRTGRTDLLVAWAMALTVRLVLACVVETPTVLGDEVDYFLAARHPEGHAGLLSTTYPPLYPAVLSAVARIGSRETGYLLCRVLNAAISSTIVPLTMPLWAPAGVAAGCIVGLMAPGVVTSGLVLSENLFLPVLALWVLAAGRWLNHPAGLAGIGLGLAASAAALTRGAGGAVVIATAVLVVLRRSSLRGIVGSLLGLAPVVVYVIMRSSQPPCAFNDPLRVAHPPEVIRAVVPTLADLTANTVLEALAGIVPWPFVFVGFWFGYWYLQYALYVVLGTAGVAMRFVRYRGWHRNPAARFMLPLTLVTAVLVALSANHNLAGVQAAQFVRGRYVEPLIPLWCALALAAQSTAGPCRVPWRFLPLWGLAAPISLTAPQNRATVLLYPLRSLAITEDVLFRLALGIATGAVLFVACRWLLDHGYRWVRRIVAFAVVLGLLAALVRFERQHATASRDAAVAHWLAANDPRAVITVDTRGLPADSLKASGLTWVVQQIRFFSENPLLADDDSAATYRLAVEGSGLVCTAEPRPSAKQAVCLSRRRQPA